LPSAIIRQAFHHPADRAAATQENVATRQAAGDGIAWGRPVGGRRQLTSPAWHHAALREAERLVVQGKAKFSDWEATKERIRRKVAVAS
jgi:hypothetical protein